jgi:hypothetical protein
MSLLNKPKDTTKIGKQGTTVKTPKAKKLPGAFDHPSTFFKSEDSEPKHPNLKNLWAFMNGKHKS